MKTARAIGRFLLLMLKNIAPIFFDKKQAAWQSLAMPPMKRFRSERESQTGYDLMIRGPCITAGEPPVERHEPTHRTVTNRH